MRILSENETALLIGDISKIKLPDDVELYLSFGITQLFKRVSCLSNASIARDWLYLPLSNIDLLKKQLHNVPKGKSDYINKNDSVSCENYYLFPLFDNSNITIILVSKSNNIDSITRETLKCIAHTYHTFKNQNISNIINYNNFQQLLIENSDSINNFTKAVINLLVQGIPNSCSSYYFEEGEGLSRRLIVGDLAKFESLKPYIKQEQKLNWKSLISKNENFIPVISLANEIQFLVNPPDFIFVHDGLMTESSDNFITLIVPGSTGLQEVQFLKSIASMVTKLSEKQFLKSSLIIDYYNNFNLEDDKSKSILMLFEKLFTLANNQLRVTKLCLFEENHTTEISLSKDGSYNALEESTIQLKQQFIEELENSSNVIIKEASDNECYRGLSQTYNARVRSEFYIKYNQTDGTSIIISVGTPKSVSALNDFKFFLRDATAAFAKCYEYKKSNISLCEITFNEKLLKSRFELTSKLSNGCFYQISSKLTVLNGKIEYLKNYIFSKKQINIDEITKYLSSIEECTDFVSNYVTTLHSMLPNGDSYYIRMIDSNEMMNKIASFLHGYIHDIYVNKNISLRLDNNTQKNNGFSISGIEIDDVVIPLILAVLDEAVIDGTISYAAISELEAEYINISFHKDLISHKEISTLISNQFLVHNMQKDIDDNYAIGTLTISYVVAENDMVTIKVRLKDKVLSKMSNTEIMYEKG